MALWWLGGLGFRNEIISQNLLFKNCLAQVLEIWYVTLPGCPLLTKIPGSKMAPGQGVLGSKHRTA